ncbi:MAG TPA: hypothetical protein VGM89_15990 [Puia sp.]
MRIIPSLPVLTLALAPFLTRCTNASSHEQAPAPPRAAVKKAHPKSDSLVSEPQVTHIASGNISAQVSRVVCYSYLDMEDYEEDTLTKGATFQMMPGFSRYLWKYDAHPKVILTKRQTHKLLAILSSPKTYKPIRSSCRSPRNCFCFYNKKKEIIGYYQVSFESGRLIAVPGFAGSDSGTFTEQGLKRLRNLCLSAGITVR